MKEQIIDKAYFMLESIVGKADTEGDFLDNVTVTFKAGMKNFSLVAVPSEKLLEFIFAGEKYALGSGEFCDFIADGMKNYEAMTLDYNERGRKITLYCDNKDVKVTNTKTSEGIVTPQKQASGTAVECGSGKISTSVLGNREYVIKAGDAQKLLKVIGIMGANGKIKNDKIRKYNQIDHFVELIIPLLKSLCEKGGGKRPVRIIDCACGKSYLSFVLNYYIKEVMGRRCYFTGLDYNETVIEDSKKMAEELGYKNMTFVRTDIGLYEPEEEFDLLLTLHACDTATDKALNFAIKNRISHIVCVPCCHREMNSNYSLPGFESIMKYGILKARIADSLTDGLRANYLEAVGYEVSVVEYISPLDTPKNLLIRAEKTSDEIDYNKIKAFSDMVNRLGTKLSIGEI